MNVSSINDYWKWYQLRGSSVTTTDSTSQSTQSSSPKNDIGLDVRNFLDKVTSGTVTDSDLSSMKDELTDAKEQFGSTCPSMMGKDMSDFLNKVQDGSVTDDDLTAMKENLEKRKQHFAINPMMMGGIPPMMGNSGDDSEIGQNSDFIKVFLDKVKDGTVTDSDLSAMQEKLSAVQGESGTQEMPPPPRPAADDTTNQSSTYLTQQIIDSAFQAYDNQSYYDDDENNYFNWLSSSTQDIKI